METNEVQALLAWFGVQTTDQIGSTDKFKAVVSQLISNGELTPTGYKVSREVNLYGDYKAVLTVYSPNACNGFILDGDNMSWVISGSIHPIVGI
jgi:hypothetical protein